MFAAWAAILISCNEASFKSKVLSSIFNPAAFSSFIFFKFASANASFLSFLSNMSANALTSNPTALANACLWTIFIAKNSSWVPACAEISSINLPVWPIKAYSLAFSRFNCLPVSNSASISLSIEDWKSNILLDIPSIWFNSKPNLFALNIPSAIANELPLKLALKFPDTFVASSKLPITSAVNPSCELKSPAWPKYSLVISLRGLPVLTDSKNNLAEASALKPNFSDIIVASATFALISPPKSPNIFTWKPNFLLIASMVFNNPSWVIATPPAAFEAKLNPSTVS